MEQLSFDYLLTEEKYYTVSELTREIKILLETRIPEVWVEGEISNFTHHSSGHMYFSLKDEHAQISCVMWRSRNNTLFFTPQDGMKIIVRGRITVYEKRGNYQLEVLQLHPAGVGELQLAFEQLKNRLRKEGLFDPAHKKPIPPYPERIGIVTSPTGAAIRDMIHILQRRFPPVEIILNPVRVQGEGAAVEIAQAIDQFNRYGQVDVLIVGRGGGSLEDLWAFNEEIVARAIFRSQIPVISAVGHEVDFSISDFVADLRAPTPSAAAELVVRNREEILAHLQKDLQKMTNGMLELIRTHRKRLQHIASGYAFRLPADIIKQHQQRLDEIKRNLKTFITHKLQMYQENLNGLEKRLALLDHKNILQRGYSLVFRQPEGKLIKQAQELNPDDKIEIQFYQGKALGTVNQILEDKSE